MGVNISCKLEFVNNAPTVISAFTIMQMLERLSQPLDLEAEAMCHWNRIMCVRKGEGVARISNEGLITSLSFLWGKVKLLEFRVP